MTVLSSFDFGAARANQKWNWEVLTDGKIRKLVKGKDYNAKYAAAQIRVYAKQHGLEVKVSKGNPTDDEVIVQFVKTAKVKKAKTAKVKKAKTTKVVKADAAEAPAQA